MQARIKSESLSNLVVFIGVNLLDCFTTYFALLGNAVEANPIPRHLITEVGLIFFLLLKAVVGIFIGYFFYKIGRSKWLIIPSYGLWLVSVINICVIFGVI